METPKIIEYRKVRSWDEFTEMHKETIHAHAEENVEGFWIHVLTDFVNIKGQEILEFTFAKITPETLKEFTHHDIIDYAMRTEVQ